jgi:hypothetical protein
MSEDVAFRDLDARSKPVLRVAAGVGGHDLGPEFEKYGVALVGRGESGDWREETDKSVFLNERASLAALQLASRGDLVVMNRGQNVLTAGVVAAPYSYHPEFGYIQGWDLFHCLRVCWIPRSSIQTTSRPKIRGARGTARWLGGANASVTSWARRNVKRALDAEILTGRLPELPTSGKALALRRVPARVRPIVARAIRLREAVRDEREWRDLPSEHETVALLVVPMLLALGWPPQNIALEWHHIDVAAFRGSRREDCAVLVEAKRLGSGLAGARNQAFEYADRNHLDVPIITTDGDVWELHRDRLDMQPARAFFPVLDTTALEFFERLEALCAPPNDMT